MVASSAETSVNYGWETAWGTVQATTDKSFGDIQAFTINRDNSKIQVDGLGDQDPAAQTSGNFVGTFNMDIIPRDWWWLRGIIGDPAKAGSGPYTYDYTYQDTPDSFSAAYSLELGATDSLQELIGCQLGSATINVNAGEVVSASLEGSYKTERETGGSYESQVASTEEPFNSAQASLSLFGSSVTPITNCVVTLNRNMTMAHGLGSRLAAYRYYGMRTLDMSITMPFEDVTDALDDFYGQDGSPDTTVVPEPAGTTVLTITNGEASTALRSLVFTLASATVFPNTETQTVSPGEIATEDITITGRSLTSCVWTNNTSTEP